ncbi:MAG TPA: DeoR family transcriptional regulator [Roseiflexaceae bacterium]|nr:DeoR family transcriptional regulator [Roseiflexaceae bacterium]
MGQLPFSENTPANKILAHLQRHGEAAIKELEEVLGVSTTAVREHLTNLQTRELVATRLVRRGPGRPHLAYFLTPKAQELFPKEYDTLINLLLRELSQRAGPDQLQSILDAVGARLAEEYRAGVSGEQLHERLAALRAALESRGIPADIQPEGDGLSLFACPYLDVAQEHAAVCRMEQHMLEQVLGEKLHLEGRIREGGRSCHFSVSPPKQDS